MKRTRERISLTSQKRRKASPLALIGVGITLLVVLGAGAIFVIPRIITHAAGATNTNCTLVVPANPLSAQGLATPYQLQATNANDGPCNEANTDQSAFVQGVIYDPNTGALSDYNPLVIDAGTQPAVAPQAPALPQGAIVGIWFGFNADTLTLQGATRNTLGQGRCVNGLRGSAFGQFAYCNAPAFFTAVNQGIAAGKVQVPALQTANDGMTCPTVRDFSVVDQDQSDNVQTQYLATADGTIAQKTDANAAQLQNPATLGNPSDNALVTNFIDPALGCDSWKIPNLANNNALVPTLATDELQAAAFQQAPIALLPLTNPMTLQNNNQSMAKTNIYRRGVDQPQAANANDASGMVYCQNMVQTGLARMQVDQATTTAAASPDPGAANSLFTFLAQRFASAYELLNCQNLLNQPVPLTVQTDANGVATAATITLGNGGNGGNNGGGNGGNGGAGGVQQTAQGTANFRLITRWRGATIQANVTYPDHANGNVQLQVRTDSCTGNAIFSRRVRLDANSAASVTTFVNNVRGNALPANWFFAVVDPAQKDANGQPLVVGCGTVTPNGTRGQATLGTVTQ
ncbi:MAG TPA: hypothetical protein VFN35_35065 [Ktedonobacteraceae bacterium]|nr:hypothetical protein [Ktedonobacteraceae bacterium]